jgi:hypothetical protein
VRSDPEKWVPSNIGFGSICEIAYSGNDAIVESVEKSYDFPTLPTMAWMPLRGIHIPTKPTAILLDREKRKP